MTSPFPPGYRLATDAERQCLPVGAMFCYANRDWQASTNINKPAQDPFPYIVPCDPIIALSAAYTNALTAASEALANVSYSVPLPECLDRIAKAGKAADYARGLGDALAIVRGAQ
jgi:hypothetical protein